MKKTSGLLSCVVTALAACALCRVTLAADDATVGGPPTDMVADLTLGGQTLMPSGWKVSPAGTATRLAGDMPTCMQLTRDGKYLLTATGGYTEHGISVIEVATGKMIDHVKVPATFAGMCIDSTGNHVRLSPGGDTDAPTLYSFAFDSGKLKPRMALTSRPSTLSDGSSAVLPPARMASPTSSAYRATRSFALTPMASR